MQYAIDAHRGDGVPHAIAEGRHIALAPHVADHLVVSQIVVVGPHVEPVDPELRGAEGQSAGQSHRHRCEALDDPHATEASCQRVVDPSAGAH